MARKKIESLITLHSWEECDEALREIGEHARDLTEIENTMNEQMATVKSVAADKARPLHEKIAQLELALEEYATAHRSDMGKAKSKALNFGVISFRRSTKVSLPSATEKIALVIQKLLKLGMDECVVQPPPKVDKDALRKYGADAVAEVGGTLISKDVFGYEIAQETTEA